MNVITLTRDEYAAQITAHLIAAADAAHAQYPQYAGHWDGWVAMRATREVRTKGGVRVTAGEVVLVDPATLTGGGSPIFHSSRGQIDAAGHDGMVEAL